MIYRYLRLPFRFLACCASRGTERSQGNGKTNAAARVCVAGQANEADVQGWHEARGGNRSVIGKDFAVSARSHERRFVLESYPAVARHRDSKSLDRPHASAQSDLANDREMDIAHARWVFHRGTAQELYRCATASEVRAD